MAKICIFFLLSSISFLVSRFSNSPVSFLFSLFYISPFLFCLLSFLFTFLSSPRVKPTKKGGRPSNVFRHPLFGQNIVRVLQLTSLDADLSLKYVRITPHTHQDSVNDVSRIISED